MALDDDTELTTSVKDTAKVDVVEFMVGTSVTMGIADSVALG
jgi:hypothetical protein